MEMPVRIAVSPNGRDPARRMPYPRDQDRGAQRQRLLRREAGAERRRPSTSRDRAVTAFIGPSGCGKSTFLRCINRMNDTIAGCRVTGKIELDGEDIYDPELDVVQLRARVGMVFQKPNPFPKSIYENVAYGPRIHGLASSKAELDEIVHCELAQGRPVRGGEGPPERARHRPVRRPAAASVHRPRHRRRRPRSS